MSASRDWPSTPGQLAFQRPRPVAASRPHDQDRAREPAVGQSDGVPCLNLMAAVRCDPLSGSLSHDGEGTWHVHPSLHLRKRTDEWGRGDAILRRFRRSSECHSDMECGGWAIIPTLSLRGRGTEAPPGTAPREGRQRRAAVLVAKELDRAAADEPLRDVDVPVGVNSEPVRTVELASHEPISPNG